MNEENTVTIDGKEYDVNTLTDKAKGDLASLQLTDRKIAEKKQELAILQTARNAYAQSLTVHLPEEKTIN